MCDACDGWGYELTVYDGKIPCRLCGEGTDEQPATVVYLAAQIAKSVDLCLCGWEFVGQSAIVFRSKKGGEWRPIGRFSVEYMELMLTLEYSDFWDRMFRMLDQLLNADSSRVV